MLPLATYLHNHRDKTTHTIWNPFEVRSVAYCCTSSPISVHHWQLVMVLWHPRLPHMRSNSWRERLEHCAEAKFGHVTSDTSVRFLSCESQYSCSNNPEINKNVNNYRARIFDYLLGLLVAMILRICSLSCKDITLNFIARGLILIFVISNYR